MRTVRRMERFCLASSCSVRVDGECVGGVWWWEEGASGGVKMRRTRVDVFCGLFFVCRKRKFGRSVSFIVGS